MDGLARKNNYANNLSRKKMRAAISALIGIVKIHAHKRLIVTPQRTADKRLVAPTPIMEPVMVCVVLTGM